MNEDKINLGDNTAIVELVEKRRLLEVEIAKLIEDFSAANGVTIEGISIEHAPPMMNQQGDIINRIGYRVELRMWI